MSTIGHPLSDPSNLLTPFFLASEDPFQDAQRAHRVSATARPRVCPPWMRSPPCTSPLQDAAPPYFFFHPGSDGRRLRSWVAASAAQEPRMSCGGRRPSNIFRLSAICQGIAARVAARQASSEKAKQHADARAPLAVFAWRLAEQVAGAG